jgi:hypothetical protein
MQVTGTREGPATRAHSHVRRRDPREGSPEELSEIGKLGPAHASPEELRRDGITI